MVALIVFVLAVGVISWLLVKTRRILDTAYLQVQRRREELGLPPIHGAEFVWGEPRRLWVEISELQEAEKQDGLRAKNTNFVLSALMHGMLEGVLVVDAQGKIRAANEVVHWLFGLNSDVVGLSLSEAFRSKDLHGIFQHALREGQVSQTLEISAPAQRLLEVNGAVVRDAGGRANGTVLVLHDQTRLKHLENTRKQFVANVSHEIRTPLSIVKGYVEALADNPELDDAQRSQFLAIIQRNTERISSLVSDLLLLSKLESNGAHGEFRTVDVGRLIHQTCEDFRPICVEKKMTLEIGDSATDTVRADPSRLRQALDNLLDNAIRYSRPDSRITLRAENEGAAVKFSVADQGCGISETDLPHIFERFYRAEKSRARDSEARETQAGTGLGLSIVEQIVQQHGGRVWVESDLGRGSTFYFTVPRADAASQNS